MIRLLLLLLGTVTTGKARRRNRARYPADGARGGADRAGWQDGPAYASAGQPGAPQAGVGQPSVGQPGVGDVGVGQLGAGQPGAGYPPGGYDGAAYQGSDIPGGGYRGAGIQGPGFQGASYQGTGHQVAGYQGTGYQGTEPLYGGPGRGTWPADAAPPPGWPPAPGRGRGRDDGPWRGGGRRRRIPRWVKWAGGLVLVGLIFRRAVASVVLIALSTTLHFLGFNIHLPHIRFAWPWQTITAGTTTNTDLGPWVLQKIEGISRPALGQANFDFVFTHKVSKSIGPWPCWYASTFYAVGHASATVNLNPGPAWWAPATGHYRLTVLSRPAGTKHGSVQISMSLPRPQLPQSAHDVTIDNLPSKPLATQHSWTYPGLGCGVLLRPQFPESVLYSQAQSIAFYKATHSPQITRPLIGTAESQATQTIRNNFVQPTLNALGYTLAGFTIHWIAGPAPGAAGPTSAAGAPSPRAHTTP